MSETKLDQARREAKAAALAQQGKHPAIRVTIGGKPAAEWLNAKKTSSSGAGRPPASAG